MMALTEMSAAILMVGMMSLASAGPLPPSSREENITQSVHLHRYAQDNATRFEPPPNVNSSLFEPQRNDSMNGTQLHQPELFSHDSRVHDPLRFPSRSINIKRCFLPTCLTTNLGSNLQHGDEKAGGDTRDPLGFGKK